MSQASSIDMERRSSAVTLSDMEIFVFPELMYSLMLANIMSPRIWRWLEDPWFADIETMKPYKRITRLKQYIMDHYVFNLDLDTWGLTHTEREKERFRDHIDEDTLSRSNALFGYEGDKYYFDIDIRTHFGLDKYEGSIIPYWKTETVEAMDAFRFKPNYEEGAGECVSLAALYAAALFVVARVPIDDIYLMATPLHSQNFIDVNDGILTNNRRLVTKNMWFNGTALSAQARRALENEQVTVITHATGTIHAIYEEATIDPDAYARFRRKLAAYLKTRLDSEALGCFLRQNQGIQKCFQLRTERHGVDRYIALDKAFAYENGSPYKITDNTRAKLMAEIDGEEFEFRSLPSRIVLNDLEEFILAAPVDIDNDDDVARLKTRFSSDCLNAEIALNELLQFCHVRPRLPEASTKQFCNGQMSLDLDVDMGRDQIITRLESLRQGNRIADLAFYAYRDLTRVESEPFLIASTCRNPVCIEETKDLAKEEIIARLKTMPNESIYDEPGRLAQPDEVWNFQRGDGAEKAVLLANIMLARTPADTMSIKLEADTATLLVNDTSTTFDTAKQLPSQTWAIPAVSS